MAHTHPRMPSRRLVAILYATWRRRSKASRERQSCTRWRGNRLLRDHRIHRAAHSRLTGWRLNMIALILEIVIATAIAYAIWNSGHPIVAVVAWFVIMGVSNTALERR